MGWWKFTHKCQTFWQLSWADRRTFLATLFLLPGMALALQILGFRRVWDYLNRGPAPAPADPTHLHARLQMIHLATRYCPFRANCLQRSLVLWWLLRQAGVSTALRIGVRKTAADLSAHAWVEYEGQVLNDQADIHQVFAPFEK
ncbi:hypothetical protein BST81_25005 [Leptolyngbya sp. 'hensonii']|uniref:lasso peptide biosynthesis B2 protein n=1 Tax=Leptolyngbya sp. 'hensonii' TaxID=1922337 RepID=UPI0009500BBE|nr:lasso peptide biosynthesis B2 protein [Leptolyngbya sp. 'hensonii']OLP15691.1 hypothetical protein BST81_25005 [Leptolyngbya sp. 'hensonii']